MGDQESVAREVSSDPRRPPRFGGVRFNHIRDRGGAPAAIEQRRPQVEECRGSIRADAHGRPAIRGLTVASIVKGHVCLVPLESEARVSHPRPCCACRLLSIAGRCDRTGLARVLHRRNITRSQSAVHTRFERVWQRERRVLSQPAFSVTRNSDRHLPTFRSEGVQNFLSPPCARARAGATSGSPWKFFRTDGCA